MKYKTFLIWTTILLFIILTFSTFRFIYYPLVKGYTYEARNAVFKIPLCKGVTRIDEQCTVEEQEVFNSNRQLKLNNIATFGYTLNGSSIIIYLIGNGVYYLLKKE